MLALLTIVFVLSGAAGLIYESIWSRYLGLFVGHSAYAQILVLVIFLGGMSLGAWLAGERTARLARPLVAYAIVEILAGVVGFLFHGTYDLATRAAYESLFPLTAGAGDLAVTVAKWTIAGLLILPQSILLGMTFPLMSAGVLRLNPTRPGHILGLLYFANSVGAAAGVLLAGFWLVAEFGLPGTLRAAAGLNLLVGAAILATDWFWLRSGEPDRDEWKEPNVVTPSLDGESPPPLIERPHTPVSDGKRSLPPLRVLWPLLLSVSFGTAVASFVYEIAWIRMLALVLGSATHSFELMLSAFILGLALGAWWVRRRADRFSDPLVALGLAQWIMGVLAIATLPLYLASFGWSAELLTIFERGDAGYIAYGVARYAICLLIMLPATFCAGMTLPLITRILLTAGGGERSIGVVYSVNTLGSIVGVALAGLVLMPLLGVHLLLVVGALVDIALGLVLLAGPFGASYAARTRRLIPITASATVVYVIFSALSFRPDRSLLSSGVFRYATVPSAGQYRVHFYRDGRTASVSVRDNGPNGMLTLSTNGKPDASMERGWLRRGSREANAYTLSSDMGTQLLLPIITMAHAPNARTAAVIGQGSGLTSHVLLASPRLQRLETVEIEPEMIAASRFFYPANGRVFDDPRATFVIDDAKAHFSARRRTYDVILSEPSNPWVSGVSGLFTREFYRHVRQHLTAGGIFGQWLHLYEINDELVLSVLAALDESFPTYDVFFTGWSDILIVATTAPRLSAADWSLLQLPGIQADLKGVVPVTTESLARLRFASADVLRPLLATVHTPNSDYHPVLDLGAERARFTRIGAQGVRGLGTERFDITSALENRPSGFGSSGSAAIPDLPRVAGLARGARLRAQSQGRTLVVPYAVADVRYDSAMYRMQRLQQLDRANLAPASWRLWLADVRALEEALHMGTAGVADEVFYTNVRGYARRLGAPQGVHDALDFWHGLAAWNWREALTAAERMKLAISAGAAWLHAGSIRDGAATAAIRLGDRAQAWRMITELTTGDASDDAAFRLRTRLLQAHAAKLGAPIATERDAP
jgi:spermidine synthase